jgi:hypothetical protein
MVTYAGRHALENLISDGINLYHGVSAFFYWNCGGIAS